MKIDSHQGNFINDTLLQMRDLIESIDQFLESHYEPNTDRLAINKINIADKKDIQLCKLAESILHSRRRRNEIFSEWCLFGEPAYEMLLDLFIAYSKNRLLPVSSVCIVSGVPFSTALRWMKILESYSLVERYQDQRDGRRSLVQLSKRGAELMREYLSGAWQNLITANQNLL